jgi:4-amino-4-deoxy-L-arabinose transferase-like glycosyltransferase
MIRAMRTVLRHPILCIVAATILSRLCMLAYFLHSRPDIFVWNKYECGMIAAALVKGHGFSGGFHDYSGPTAWFAPAYPVMLSGIFEILGTQTFASAVAAYLMNILFAAVTAVLAVKIGTKLCNRTTAVLGGFTWGLMPQAALPGFIFSERTLATMMLCLSIFLTLHITALRRKGGPLVCGIALGLAGLVSPAVLACLPLLVVYVYKKNPTLRWAPVIMITTCCVVLAPWTIRNAVMLHRIVPVRDNGLAEIYFANVGYDENPYGMSMEYQKLGEPKFLDMVERKLIVYVRARPCKFLRDSLERVYRFWTTPEGLFGYSALIVYLAGLGCWCSSETHGLVLCRSWRSWVFTR